MNKSLANKNSILIVTLISLFAFATVIWLVVSFANEVQNINSSIGITYTSKEVEGQMRLRAYHHGSWDYLTGDKDVNDGFIELSATDTLLEAYTSADLNSGSELALDINNNFIVFECAFKNEGSALVTMSFEETNIMSDYNIKKTQKWTNEELTVGSFGNINDSTSAYSSVATLGNADSKYTGSYTYYYYRIEVNNKSMNAGYQVSHNWKFTTEKDLDKTASITLNNDGVETVVQLLEGAIYPIPYEERANYVFNGYYTGENKTGTKITNELGMTLSGIELDKLTSATLYSGGYTQAFETHPGVIILHGDRAEYITSIEIPADIDIVYNDFSSGRLSNLASIKVAEGNTTYTSQYDGVECNAIIDKTTNTLILGCKNTIIPNNVTSISGHVFNGSLGLTFIEIPDSVTYISGGENSPAFTGCDDLKAIILPESVEIGGNAFESTYVETIYYRGDKMSDCQSIIENVNGLKNATIYLYSNTLPEGKGVYWHYNSAHMPELW